MEKAIINNTEVRHVSYKKLLEEVNKDKAHFPPTDEFVIWYKSFLREQKTFEESLLAKLVKEKTNENQGLNPPFFYR